MVNTMTRRGRGYPLVIPEGISKENGWLRNGGVHPQVLYRRRLEREARERQEAAAELAAELPRPPTAHQAMMIEAAASAIVEGRRLRLKGRQGHRAGQNVVRALRALGVGAYRKTRKTGVVRQDHDASISARDCLSGAVATANAGRGKGALMRDIRQALCDPRSVRSAMARTAKVGLRA
jgi:hypothetical protein